MNDVSNRAVREFSEFLDRIEINFPKPTCTTAYEITMKSTIVSALITLDTEKQIKLAFEQSEKEVADLHQRTREGLLTARLNGRQVGRKKGTGFETKKSKAAKEKIRIHYKAFGGTLDDMECMKLTGLARNTYYKYKRQIREDTEMKD